MKRAAWPMLALLACGPALAKAHHGHHSVARATHQAKTAAERDSHSGITCEMVRAYVAQVGLTEATKMAESAGITSSEKERARRCLAEKS
jgi:hypothetical protein